MAVARELAEVGRLDLAPPRQLEERVELVGRHRERHPLLRLADEDLPRGEPLVLQRGLGEVEPRAARLLGHLADRAGEAAGAVVGDRRIEAEIARLEQEVEHHLLRDRVADLHRLHRALLGQFGRGEGGAVDPVLPDASADHHDPVAGGRLLDVRGTPRRLDRHPADRAAVDQRLAEVPLVEVLPAARVRHARLVAAVDHAGVDAVADAARMEQPRGKRAFVVRRAEAVAPDVREQLGAEAGAERIAVHADDAGDRPAVRIQGRRAVVRLDLVDEVVALGRGDDAGVVVEDGDEPAAALLGLEPLVDHPRRAADAGLEQRVDHLRRAPRLGVGDPRVHDLVLAVLAPCLGERLQLDVGRRAAEARRLAPRVVLRAAVEVADRPHLLQREGEEARAGDRAQLVVRDLEADRQRRARRRLDDARHGEVGAGGEPLVARLDRHPLDHLVGEELGGDPRRGEAVHAAEQVHPRGVDLPLLAELAAEEVLDRHLGALADRVGHAGLEADGDGDVERAVVEPADGADAHDRAGELVGHAAGLVVGERGFDQVDVAGPDRLDRQAEMFADPPGDGHAAAIDETGAGSDLDAGNAGHGATPSDGGGRRGGSAGAPGKGLSLTRSPSPARAYRPSFASASASGRPAASFAERTGDSSGHGIASSGSFQRIDSSPPGS